MTLSSFTPPLGLIAAISKPLRRHAAALALCFASLWLVSAPQTAQAQSCNVGGVSMPCVKKEPGPWDVSHSIYGINSSFTQTTSFEMTGTVGSVIGQFLGKVASASPPLLISSRLATGTRPTSGLDPLGAQTQSETNNANLQTIYLGSSYSPYYYSMTGYPELPDSGPVSGASGELVASTYKRCPPGTADAQALTGDPTLAGMCIESQVCSTDKPVNPLTGLKRQTVVDYQGAGAHPLSFNRTYTNYTNANMLANTGFANSLPDEVRSNGNTGGITVVYSHKAQHWLHNYSSVVQFNAFQSSLHLCPGLQPAAGLQWGNDASTKVRRSDGRVFYFTLAAGTIPGSCNAPGSVASGVTRVVNLVSSQTRDTLSVTLNSLHQAISAQYRVFETDQIERYSFANFTLANSSAMRLDSITDRNGWITTLAYTAASTPLRDYIEGSTSTAGSATTIPGAPADTAGLLLSVTNAFGRQLRFVYTPNGHLSQLLPPGAVKDSPVGAATSPIRYAYTPTTQFAPHSLERVTWQDGTSKLYHYEATLNPTTRQLLTGITDEAGVRTDTYRYDTQARIVEEYGAPGADGVRSYHLSFGYTIYAEVQTTVTDHVARNAAGQIQADNRSYRFARVAAGSVSGAPSLFATTLTAPCSVCGGTGALTINGPYNQPIKAVAHDGMVTFTTYDTKGRATEVATFPASQSGAWPRPALSLATSVVSTQWHASWNLPLKVAEAKSITAYTYNAKGMMTGEATTPTTDLTGSLKFAAVRDFGGELRSTGFAFNSANSIITKIEKVDTDLVSSYSYSYSSLGQLAKLFDKMGSNLSATFTSNGHGNIVDIVVSNTATAKLIWNVRGQISRIIQPGLSVDLTYDTRGLLTLSTFSDGRTVRFNFSSTGNLLPNISRSISALHKTDSLINSLDTGFIGSKTYNFNQSDSKFAVVAIPVVIVGGLVIITGSKKTEPCCGAAPEVTGGRGGSNSNSRAPPFLQVVGILTAVAADTAETILDKAGLPVHPLSCIPPPGYCKQDDYDKKKDTYERECKQGKRSCQKVGLTPSEIDYRLDKNFRCARARDDINAVCFKGGNREHRDEAHNAWKDYSNCVDAKRNLPAL